MKMRIVHSVFAIALTLTVFGRLALDVRAQSTLPAELGRFEEGGAAVALLASAVVGASPSDNDALTLSRVVPVSGDELPVVISGGQELWFVESGRVTLTSESGAVIAADAGTQAVLTEPGQYTLRFEGDQCPSALRLEFSSIIAMRMTSEETGPELGPNGVPCPEGGLLLETAESVAPRPSPAIGFISRVTLNSDAFLSSDPYSGPIGYAVERGLVTLSGPEMINLGLAPGSWTSVKAGQSHWIFSPGPGETVVLVVGAFATDQIEPTVQPTPTTQVGVVGSRYVSPTYGYSLSWDDTWNVVDETSEAGTDTLHLSNGTSGLYFQSYGSFTGDAIACVNDLTSRLSTQEGFGNVRPRLTADGKPLISGDSQRRLAVVDFAYTTSEGSSEYTESIECVVLANSAVLVITNIVLADLYPAQIEPVRAVVSTLRIGEGS